MTQPGSAPMFNMRPQIPDIQDLSFWDKMKIFRRIYGFVGPYKYFLSLMLVLTLVGVILGMIDPFLTQILLDDVLVQGDKKLLNIICGVIMGLFLVRSLYGFIAHYISFYMLTRINFDMRIRFFQHLEKLSNRYYEQNPLADTAHTENSNLPQVQGFIINSLTELSGHVMELIVAMSLMMTIQLDLALVSFIVLPLWIYLTNWFTVKMGPMQQEMNEKSIDLKNVFFQFIAAIPLVKITNQGPYERKRYFGQLTGIAQKNIRIMVWGYSYGIIVGGLTLASTTMVFWWGGSKVIDGTLSMGQLIAFNMFLGKLLGPIGALLGFYQGLNPICVAALRVFAVWDLPYEIENRPNAVPIKNFRGYIEFNDVHFAYDRDVPVLQNLNFEVLPGEMIAFCGPSGSGKSTVAKLLTRSYDPLAGQIFIDSFDLRDLKIEDYLQQVGVVFQRPIMFQDTILKNIKYGCQDAPPEEVIRACNIAQAHDFIQQLPQQYETTLGAHDSGLSGGQIQRISLARIILRDPKILILDEATSALDTETEMQIKAGLDYLMRGRTTVAIAHRLSTIVDADKIVVLDRGRVQEIGNHEELLAKRGLYYGLCQKQLGDSGEMH